MFDARDLTKALGGRWHGSYPRPHRHGGAAEDQHLADRAHVEIER